MAFTEDTINGVWFKTYSITTDTANALLDIEVLDTEFEESAFGIDAFISGASGSDDFRVDAVSNPSGAQETTSDGLVTAHTGVSLPALGLLGETESVIYDEFTHGPTGDLDWIYLSGGGTPTIAADQTNSTDTHIGIIKITLPVATTSVVTMTSGAAGGKQFSVGNGEAAYISVVYIPTLSIAAAEYWLKFGLADAGGLAANFDHLMFMYDRAGTLPESGGSANWIVCNGKNGTETITTSGTAVTTGWHVLKFVVNAAGTSVEFFVDDVSMATHTTNIPLGTNGDIMFAVNDFGSSAGFNSKTISIDTFCFKKQFDSRY